MNSRNRQGGFLLYFRLFRGFFKEADWLMVSSYSHCPHLQKSHSNGSNKGHGQFQQKSCTLDVQNLKNGLKFVFIIGHQRKSPFCTFSCINPGFGRPWDMLRKKIFIAIFIMLQKNAFGQKKFEFNARVQKCHFGKNEKLPKWHF